MKRDMDLIRKILLAVENGEHGFVRAKLEFEGYSEEAIGYHTYLIVNAGLATGVDTTGRGDDSPSCLLVNLTWAGHEFVDAARNETIWQNAKSRVSTAIGSVTFAILTQMLGQIAQQKLGMTP